MRILTALVFPMLALACGGPASSAPSSESGETELATTEASDDTTEVSTGAEGDSPPQCVAMG
jgi:hypothetical protein